jgi:hypothetical protein
MNERERLIELLNQAHQEYYSHLDFSKTYMEALVDSLIANGVTVISASEPKTNGDRIRAMTDDELADTWMRDFVVCHRCAYRYECECDESVTIEKCREGIVEWLKQPAKEEE